MVYRKGGRGQGSYIVIIVVVAAGIRITVRLVEAAIVTVVWIVATSVRGVIPVIAIPFTVIAFLITGDEGIRAENVGNGWEAIVCLICWGHMVDGGVHTMV